MDGSIFQAPGTACVKSRNKEVTSHIWELREGQHGWSTEREKLNSKNKVGSLKKNFLPLLVPPSVLVCPPQGGTQDPTPGLWPPSHPKGLSFVPTEQRGKTEVIQLQVPATM